MLSADSVISFNEILYNPLDPSDTEWVEIANQNSVQVDLSGWSITGGIDYVFPSGTVLPGGGYLLVAKDPQASGLSGAVGPFSGKLSNGGEQIELRTKTGRLMDELDYDDEDDWSVGPDGAGPTLAKIKLDSASGLAGNWRSSLNFGGTPGSANFPGSSAIVPSVLKINEVASASDASFWIEVQNTSSSTVNLDGYAVRIDGSTETVTVLGTQTIASGAYAVIDQATLGFSPMDEDRLFLVEPSGDSIADAVRVKDSLRGRSELHDDGWFYPNIATPGAANAFAFQSDVVINEIMYHHRPDYATAAVTNSVELLPFDSTWRYNQSGTNLGSAWAQSSHTVGSSNWQAGSGVLGFESATLPEPIRTPLSLGNITYFFETDFDASAIPADVTEIQLNHLVDDGAVFYLNGVEVNRFNMPGFVGAPVSAGQLASGALTNASNQSFSIPVSQLVNGSNRLSVEVHQASIGSSDVVMGVQLVFQQVVEPATEFQDNGQEWVELYNKGSQAIDLSGSQIDDAVRFTFPGNSALLGAGEYLVVARDQVALAAQHPGIRIDGEFDGKFSNSGERILLVDANRNIADQVEYYDGNPWDGRADGGGASLELRNPDADNASAQAWTASDEAGVLDRSTWNNYSYTKTVDPIVYDPTINFHEFVMGLLDEGEVLIDNITVTDVTGGGTLQLLQNTDFELDATDGSAGAWRIQGTHGSSRVIQDPNDSLNQVLQLIAEGPMNYISNHAETTLAGGQRVTVGHTYEISYDAKWISGSPQLHTELYYKDAARTTVLSMPLLSGTPGVANSTLVQNTGPTYEGFRHGPIIPSSGESVTVSVTAQDSDGVQSMTLYYAANGSSNYVSVPMSLVADGSYQGVIPAMSNGRIVQFYVEGEDSEGMKSTYPSEGPASRAMYRVDNGFTLDSARHNFQILMLPGEANALHIPTEWMNNNREGATVVYNGQEVYYDVGIKLKGSMWTRRDQATTGYNVRFHTDHLFRGIHKSVKLDQKNEIEIQVKHLANQASVLGASYDDVVRLQTPTLVGGGPTLMAMAGQGKIFLDSQFDDGSDGTAFKLEGIRVLQQNTSSPEDLKTYIPIGWVNALDIADLGDDKELYRWPFLIENNRDRDDYSGFIEMAKAFSLGGNALRTAAEEVIDVDQWMRTFALQTLVGAVDVYSVDNSHNLLFYQRPSDNKFLAFPQDWDAAFRDNNTSIDLGRNIGKIADLPGYQRLYQGHLLDMIGTVYNSDYMSQWSSHFGDLLQSNFSNIPGYIDQRGNAILNQLQSQISFEITTNAGADFSTEESAVTLSGEGWIDVRDIRYSGSEENLAVTWIDDETGRIDCGLMGHRSRMQTRSISTRASSTPMAFSPNTGTSAKMAKLASTISLVSERLLGYQQET